MELTSTFFSSPVPTILPTVISNWASLLASLSLFGFAGIVDVILHVKQPTTLSPFCLRAFKKPHCGRAVKTREGQVLHVRRTSLTPKISSQTSLCKTNGAFIMQGKKISFAASVANAFTAQMKMVLYAYSTV